MTTFQMIMGIFLLLIIAIIGAGAYSVADDLNEERKRERKEREDDDT